MTTKREKETLLDYKVRLFQNRAKYKLSWKDIRDILGDNVNPDTVRKGARGYLEAYRDMKNITFDRRVLVLNDIHLPFEREDVLEIIKKHADEITHLVIGGDLLDCKDISVFPHDNCLSIIDEIKYAYNWLSEVRTILGNKPILCCKGNHENRFSKLVLKDKVLQNFVDPEILRMFEDGFTLFEGNKKIKYKPISNFKYVPKWYLELDKKIIVCHPAHFSVVPSSTLEKTCEHFINKDIDFIPELIVVAHTHKFSIIKAVRRLGIFGIENGCMCKDMEYADDGKLGYTPQVNCYSIIRYNLQGKLNMNDTTIYYL